MIVCGIGEQTYVFWFIWTRREVYGFREKRGRRGEDERKKLRAFAKWC